MHGAGSALGRAHWQGENTKRRVLACRRGLLVTLLFPDPSPLGCAAGSLLACALLGEGALLLLPSRLCSQSGVEMLARWTQVLLASCTCVLQQSNFSREGTILT